MPVVHCPECEHDFLPQLSGKIECPECALHGVEYARLLHDLPSMFDNMNVGEVCKAAGLVDVWDAAVPQEWYDANREEIDRRGGFVIWTYPKGNMFGQPMFADELFMRAAKNQDVFVK
jgi:hypothetical protein